MEVLIAPDSFKGSLSSIQFCQIARQAILKLKPSASIHMFPLADGGEGSLDVIAWLCGVAVQQFQLKVEDPLGRPVKAKFLLLNDRKTALIELAEASGLGRLSDAERDPMSASTYGTGQLIKAALDQGVDEIVLFLGGSATNDGGSGILQALGYSLLDANHQEIPKGAAGLAKLVKIDSSKNHPRLEKVDFIAAMDVDNPLLGKNAATAVYGPQKGIKPDEIPNYEATLTQFANISESKFQKSLRHAPFTGAAGGSAFAAQLFLNARPVRGFDYISELTGLTDFLKRASCDLIITGEGRIDQQTAYGKLISRLAQKAKAASIPIIGFAGEIDPMLAMEDCGLDAAFSIVSGPISLEAAKQQAEPLLFQSISNVIRTYLLGYRQKIPPSAT